MHVQLARRDAIAVLTLNRPDALNALNEAMLRQLDDALGAVATSDARALVVIGAGDRAFCAGADLRELSAKPLFAQRASLLAGQSTFMRLDALPIPSIAVVNGFALGGGLELALACTFRLATATARFGLPEIKLGLLPGFGGTQRLGRLVGTGRALEMVLSGELVDPDEALAMGLVHRLVDGDPVVAAIAYANRFTGFSLKTSWLARQALLRARDATLDDGLKIELDLATVALATDDAAEGMSAFLDKRKATFTDR